MIPNILASVAGDPKVGKTHFAMTFPEPIALFSLDMGAEYVRKTRFPDKDIDIFEFPMPLADTLTLKTGDFSKMWGELRQKIYDAIAWKNKKYKTIVVDTGSALWEVIRYAYNEEEGRAIGEGGRARTYGEPNARAYGIIQQAKIAGVNYVVLHYLKDRWEKDENTGMKELDGWRRTEGMVDVVLKMQKKSKLLPSNVRKTVFYTEIVGTRFGDNLDGVVLEMATYDDLVAVLGVEV